MFGQAFQRFPSQVQAVPARIRGFKSGQCPDRLGIVIEAPEFSQGFLQSIFPGMAERRMPDIMRETERFGQIFVEAESPRDRPANLCDLEAVGQPDAIMVAIGGDKDLSLVAQPAEGNAVDDPVAIALKIVTRAARDIALFIVQPSPTVGRIACIAVQPGHLVSSLTSTPSALAHAKPSPPPLRKSASKALAALKSSNGPTTSRRVLPQGEVQLL
jgi:hypothetical protein